MNSKKDIISSADIKRLVDSFYDKVVQDSTLGPFFNEVAHINWEKHLPIMYGFWENILFGTGNYKGNALQKHVALHAISPLKEENFETWLRLFKQTVDEIFTGSNAEQAKIRAESIATVIRIKTIK